MKPSADFKAETTEQKGVAQYILSAEKKKCTCKSNLLRKVIIQSLKNIKSFKCFMETQRTPDSQSNTEKEKWSWRNQAP